MVRNIFKSGKDLLFARQSNILSAAAIIAATLLLSRILGLLKYRLLTSYFTVSEIGLFLASFRLPNLVFDLVVMGALTTSFIPVFTACLHQDKKEADRVASTVINISLIFFLPLLVILLLFTEPIMRLITPGLSRSELNFVVPFTQIMLLGQTPPLILGNFLTGIIQSHKRFLIPAIAPVLYNLGIIAGIIILTPTVGLYAPVFGVIIGAIFFFLFQIPLAKNLGFRYQFLLDLKNKAVREIGKLVFPRLLGLGITQLNYTVNLTLSSLLSSRAITIFNFAQQLQQLPIGIFGATIAQAALPTLAEENNKDDPTSFIKTFQHSFLQILFLTLPAAAVLIVLRIPIVRLVYGASKFDWAATVDTGRTLAFFSLALVSEAIVNLVVRAFYALHISKTPVVLGSIAVGINILLSIIFIPILHYPVWGLAAAAATADIVYSIALLLFLNKRIFCLDAHLLIPMFKMLSAALITLISLYIPMKLLDQLVFDTTRTIPLLLLTSIATGCGLLVYGFLTWVLNIPQLHDFLGIFGKLRDILSKKTPLPVPAITPVETTATANETNP